MSNNIIELIKILRAMVSEFVVGSCEQDISYKIFKEIYVCLLLFKVFKLLNYAHSNQNDILHKVS